MSELINNREYRQQQLKEIIKQLHDGKSVDEVKAAFGELIEGVSATEISQMEGALVMEGMAIEEIQRLCDVHAAVFKGSIEEIHRPTHPEETKGHPVNTFLLENRALEKQMDEIERNLSLLEENPEDEKIILKLREGLNLLWDIDKHYSRKENLLFPFMERYGITAPPKVMWGVDDEIRAEIKEVKNLLAQNMDKDQWISKTKHALDRVREMIFKEENILFPMVLDTLSEDEWGVIYHDSDEIGYCLTEPAGKWQPVVNKKIEKEEKHSEVPTQKDLVRFETGIMTTAEIGALFNTLPFDITFVDKDGVVKYFSQGKERIFPRTKSIIGRQVSNCHPPASVHIVEKIVEDLKSGKKDHEDFWIQMKGQWIYIRYFAVRNEQGEFLGVAEVTQNIGPIKDLEGEKRLAD